MAGMKRFTGRSGCHADGGFEAVGGCWVIPISLLVSLVVLLVTHRTARSWLRRWRGRFQRVELPASRWEYRTSSRRPLRRS